MRHCHRSGPSPPENRITTPRAPRTRVPLCLPACVPAQFHTRTRSTRAHTHTHTQAHTHTSTHTDTHTQAHTRSRAQLEKSPGASDRAAHAHTHAAAPFSSARSLPRAPMTSIFLPPLHHTMRSLPELPEINKISDSLFKINCNCENLNIVGIFLGSSYLSPALHAAPRAQNEVNTGVKCEDIIMDLRTLSIGFNLINLMIIMNFQMESFLCKTQEFRDAFS